MTSGSNRRGGGSSKQQLNQLMQQMQQFIDEAGAPQVFPDQNPPGGGRPAILDPQAVIRMERMISTQAGFIAYLADRAAAAERNLLAATRQRSGQRRQGGR